MTSEREYLRGSIAKWRFKRGVVVQPSTSGLGDKISSVAQPIAHAIDKVAGTKITGCKGCKKMKERLNAGMPFREALKLRIQGK